MQQARYTNLVLYVAPIGVVAFNIIGYMLYNLFQLPIKQKRVDLVNGTLQALQVLFTSVQFIIINEKFMLDLYILLLINDQLQLIFLDYIDTPFSRLNILLYSNFFQLLLVSSHVLFIVSIKALATIKGQLLYQALDYIACLMQVMQQQGKDNTTIQFQTALGELQKLWLLHVSQDLLYTYVQNQLALGEVDTFQSTLWLYYIKVKVQEHNYYQLIAISQSIKQLLLTYIGYNVLKASIDEANNLLTKVLISVGMWVMLIANLQTKKGLINSFISSIKDIMQETGLDLSISLLLVLFVCFSNYSSLDFPLYPSKVVLIFSITCQFKFKGATYTYTQFLLQLAYMLIVYKSQGLMLMQVVLDINQKKHCLSLSYVAILQVKALYRLMFKAPFNYSYFIAQDSPIARDCKLDMCFRSRQLV